TDVTPFFTTATISCGRSIATRFWKEPCGSGFGRSSSKYARNWACRSYQGFCRESISTCSSRYRRTLRSAISYAGLRAGPRIAFRWSSPNFVSATGDATSGPGATSAPQAATSQTMSYFSIFVRTNLPAPAGSCSVLGGTNGCHPPPTFNIALMAAATGILSATLAFAEEISTPPPAEVRIISTEFKYVPAKVGVTVGRAVTFILDNSNAETEHGVIVPAFGFRLGAKAGEVVRKTIVLDQPGEYEFTCDPPGHREGV